MTTITPRPRKLIETGIPLQQINQESAREKSLRHGLPSTLHLYWARRPLATTRNILFAQLVDDPASRPDLFPTKEAQDEERVRLQQLMVKLAKWENTQDETLYRDVHEAIMRSNPGNVSVLDPFAGGGSIPLEAQRLGLDAHASDLNPLSVILNKALIDFPARFNGKDAVYPGTVNVDTSRAHGLAQDIQAYGNMLRDKAYAKIGHLYPSVTDAHGNKHTVIAWIWARTVTNPNPANPVQVPLVRSWWLSKKKGKEAWIKPVVHEDGTITYEVQHNADGPTGEQEGTVNRKGAVSIIDGTPIDFAYIRAQSRAHGLGHQLIAVVTDGDRGRLYCSPTDMQAEIATVNRPAELPNAELPEKALGFRVQAYGFTYWTDLFTNRQLVTLTTLSNTLEEVRAQILEDALVTGMPRGERLDDGGDGAEAYADAVVVYLALAVSRMTDYSSTICSWNILREGLRNVFARQAVPMTWDYAEINPFSSSTGNYLGQVQWVAEAVDNVPAYPQGEAHQADAATRDYSNMVISTDPPYYDNIGYSDLSDYFYVWLRPMLKNILPSCTRTLLTPKTQELVANPYRHDGKDGAAEFFNEGFHEVFSRIRKTANVNVPMTVYYAYKQQEKGSSTGWITLLDALIDAGWEVTATWPVRSEREGRLLSVGTNALASSIVLACRPRTEDAPSTTERLFKVELRKEIEFALERFISSGLDPVDLNQAIIGPGIGVYSRYRAIKHSNGDTVSVAEALDMINDMVDKAMGESELDHDTRFAVKWYQSYGWDQESSGIADQLARTNATSLTELERCRILATAGGKARLCRPEELDDPSWNPLTDVRTCWWEAIVRMSGVLATHGMAAVVPMMREVKEAMPIDQVRAMGFRLHREAEHRNDTQTTLLVNNLMTSWDSIMDQVRELDHLAPISAEPELTLDI